MNGPSMTIVAMMCSLRCDSTLLGENFNIKTDFGAFRTVFSTLENFQARCLHCAHGSVQVQQVAEYSVGGSCNVGPLFSAYRALWKTIKGQPQPMFDALITVSPSDIPFKVVAPEPTCDGPVISELLTTAMTQSIAVIGGNFLSDSPKLFIFILSFNLFFFLPLYSGEKR